MNKLTKGLLKKNNTREEAISEENDKIYTDMVVYLRSSNLTQYNQELVREDIIELILEGQQRGDNIQKVMGGRYKEICDEIIDVMPKKTRKDNVIEFIDISLSILWILGVIAIAKNLISGLVSKTSEFNFILTIGDIITAIVIIILSNGIVWYITKTALDEKTTKNKKVEFLKAWVVFSLIFAAVLLPSIYLDTVVVNISLLIAIIIALIIFVTSKVVSSKVL
ncbi:DUF1129 family protein [Irregularibacter muris]|uniref:DUF1129 family protein n=1 Tax=Irregularibacter muris TaxID=1796619 RepID=A0AAE3HDY9_9FIRM|nr:DUF1129 family protein [Irregularibacter muris]MCR1897454.1 DUF1129 family protein [Irregularibacter muris]